MTFEQYSGSAANYIREYLDPDNTLGETPTSEDEARKLWADMERIFAADAGTGIDEEDFVDAVEEMQEKFEDKTYKIAFATESTPDNWHVVETFQAKSDEEANAYAEKNYADRDWYVLDQSRKNING